MFRTQTSSQGELFRTQTSSTGKLFVQKQRHLAGSPSVLSILQTGRTDGSTRLLQPRHRAIGGGCILVSRVAIQEAARHGATYFLPVLLLIGAHLGRRHLMPTNYLFWLPFRGSNGGELGDREYALPGTSKATFRRVYLYIYNIIYITGAVKMLFESTAHRRLIFYSWASRL